MERHNGDLEKQSDRRRDNRQQQNRVARLACGDGLGNLPQAGRAAQAIEQRKAVCQKAAREGAQQQVLHRRFVRPQLAPQEADHNVEAERHQLEADEERDQVVARGHDRHAGLREQNQSVVLAAVGTLLLHVARRDDDGQHRRADKDSVEEDRKAVNDQGVVQSKAPAIDRDVTEVLPHRDRDKGLADQRGQRVPTALSQQKAGQKDSAAEQAQQYSRLQSEEICRRKEAARIKSVHSCTIPANSRFSCSGFGMPLRL